MQLFTSRKQFHFVMPSVNYEFIPWRLQTTERAGADFIHYGSTQGAEMEFKKDKLNPFCPLSYFCAVPKVSQTHIAFCM